MTSPTLGVPLEAVLGKRRIDDRREVVAVHVRHAGELTGRCGEHAVLVLGVRRHEAVGGHEDRARELGELLTLVLPRGTVVAHQVVVLLELGVGVGGKHLAVRVDVDAAPWVCSSNALRSARSCPEIRIALPVR
jgi:hypothetical protein